MMHPSLYVLVPCAVFWTTFVVYMIYLQCRAEDGDE